MFWVGLMDGCGDIQVNNLGNKLLQYRLIIKLNNNKFNYDMFIDIIKVIGGKLKIKNNNIIWLVENKEEIKNIIKIFKIYPPLTSKKICQLLFLKKCLNEISIETYILYRKFKYDKQLEIIKSISNDLNIPGYFSEWLSGFMETKGHFSLKKLNTYSFILKQNDDIYILQIIKQYFNIYNKIENPLVKLYCIETYNKEAILKIISHCINYPLLGQNLNSLKEFSQKFV